MRTGQQDALPMTLARDDFVAARMHVGKLEDGKAERPSSLPVVVANERDKLSVVHIGKRTRSQAW